MACVNSNTEQSKKAVRLTTVDLEWMQIEGVPEGRMSGSLLGDRYTGTFGEFINFPAGLESPQREFDERVEAVLSHWRAPGAVITVVKDGRILIMQGYGSVGVDRETPVTPSTHATVASVSKPVNATALAMLVEDGLIDWDDPVRKHIPEFAFSDSYRTDHTTIKDLLLHRAGLPAILPEIEFLAAAAKRDYSIEDLLRDLSGAEPMMDFRYGMGYSQAGIALAGHIVERASGLTWQAFVEDRILTLLGMNATYPGTDAFLQDYPDPELADNVMQRAIMRDGEVVKGSWWGIGPIYAPAAGLVTTGEDMAQFMLFLLNDGSHNGRQLLSKDRIDEMFTSYVLVPDFHAPIINPLTGIIVACPGWVAHEYKGRIIFEHGGSVLGTSVVALMPGEGIGVFISSGAGYPMESDRMVSAIKFTAFDFALGLPGRNWIASFRSENTTN